MLPGEIDDEEIENEFPDVDEGGKPYGIRPFGNEDFDRPESCRFIIGEPRDLNFCPKRPLPGKSYCADHMATVARPKRRKK